MNRAQLLESWISLSQILSRIFLSKNMQLELTKYCLTSKGVLEILLKLKGSLNLSKINNIFC